MDRVCYTDIKRGSIQRRDWRMLQITEMRHTMTVVFSQIFWLLLIPFCIGLVPLSLLSEQRRSAGCGFLGGYFLMWALFEVVCIPMVVKGGYHNFSIACRIFSALAILLAAVGVLCFCRQAKRGETMLGSRSAQGRQNSPAGQKKGRLLPCGFDLGIEWVLFLVLVGFQLYQSLSCASFDGDDAYYVVESLIAQQSDTMYTRLPYTGRATSLDVRHALAVFPMWVAFIAVRIDVHATIVSHMIMPVVMILLAYLLYYEIGRVLFKDRESRVIFLIIMALLQIFGNVSIYTNETFFLTRTWQGKAVAGSLVIPAVFWMLLLLFEDRKKGERADRGLWLMLVCLNMTTGICSSIAVFLVSLLMAAAAVLLALQRRDWKIVPRLAAVCIPNLIYMGLYVLIGYTSLWKLFV